MHLATVDRLKTNTIHVNSTPVATRTQFPTNSATPQFRFQLSAPLGI